MSPLNDAVKQAIRHFDDNPDGTRFGGKQYVTTPYVSACVVLNRGFSDLRRDTPLLKLLRLIEEARHHGVPFQVPEDQDIRVQLILRIAAQMVATRIRGTNLRVAAEEQERRRRARR